MKNCIKNKLSRYKFKIEYIWWSLVLRILGKEVLNLGIKKRQKIKKSRWEVGKNGKR